jgi:hypothetical protein
MRLYSGCADQTIHADTPHLFPHCPSHLPPHYLNLFLPAASPPPPPPSSSSSTRDTEGEGEEAEEAMLRLGQTAFVLDSHRLPVSAKIMAGVGLSAGMEEEEEMEQKEALLQRLVRPHLLPGDALLFDCRILHFGLANQHTNRCTRTGKEKAKVTGRKEGDKEQHPLDEESENLWRPTLYVNYHQSWFRDPKNWNSAARLFDKSHPGQGQGQGGNPATES